MLTPCMVARFCVHHKWNEKKVLKQAKEEAQVEIEKYKAERERAFKDNEVKNVGSKEDIAIKIGAL